MRRIDQVVDSGFELFRLKAEHSELKKKYVAQGDCIFAQGQTINELYWIKTGTCSVAYTAANGRRFNFGRITTDNRLMGEMEWLSERPALFGVFAEQKMELLIIPLSFIEQLVCTHSNIGLWLSRCASNIYLDGIDFTLDQLLYPLSYNLALDLEQRYLGAKPEIAFEQLYREADRFGCSERVFRRVIGQLQTMGLAEKVNHQVKVVDPSKLRAFIESMEK
ncbi:Crp/Fnr family transcriptional regulator [Shewanella colwelliana]|uniref:Crp/Fnr family transcriptional regulator n=1 Tax=Shewanella colwelliana TaxID=23 RepID=UPI0022AF3EB2|nr:Crp/Fnr family transcriptional regulator [Shewanella colwelliana]MCZ4338480.1 Crp/Fnr family transcriptional regulator [Shewanella colwelliana]